MITAKLIHRWSRWGYFFVPALLVLSIFFGLLSCGGKNESRSKQSSASAKLTAEGDQDLPVIVFLGDSLTEGYGVGAEENYPYLVEKKLAEQEIRLEVRNGGLSGDTTAGGLERLNWFLKIKPKYLFLALGANDGLRGLSLEQTYDNLSVIIERSQEQGVKVLLAGLKLPPNYGKEYNQKFEDVFTRLAKTYHLPLLPFLLEGVAGEKELNLADGIHPNPDGHEIISSQVAEFIAENL